MPRQHLPQPDGGICDEGSCIKGRAGGRIFHCLRREELGNGVYPPARQKLAEHGIPCAGHAARQITPKDYVNFDLLIGMDEENVRNMRRVFSGDPEDKISLLLDHAGRGGNVADPWYTSDFEATWRDVNDGCRALLCELS